MSLSPDSPLKLNLFKQQVTALDDGRSDSYDRGDFHLRLADYSRWLMSKTYNFPLRLAIAFFEYE
jgi:hypothetical protein